MIAIGVVPDRRPRRARRVRRRRSSRPRPNTTGGVDDLPAPAGVRVRRRGADRHRGDRDGRPGVPAARSEERRARPSRSMAGAPRPSCSSGITFLADRTSRIVPRRARTSRRSSPRSPRPVFGDSIAFFLFQAFTALLLFLAANTSFAAFPRLARGPRRGWLLPAPVRLPRRPPGVLDGHRRCWASIAGLARGRGRRRDPRADPALRGRRVHRLHDQPGRA